MKVETRILSFSDSHATANDRVTGESSFVAFRATALKNGFRDYEPGTLFSNFSPSNSFTYPSGMEKCRLQSW